MPHNLDPSMAHHRPSKPRVGDNFIGQVLDGGSVGISVEDLRGATDSCVARVVENCRPASLKALIGILAGPIDSEILKQATDAIEDFVTAYNLRLSLSHRH